MTVEMMFAPLYHQAMRQGIAPAHLDGSPPHVVRWALLGIKDEDEPETHDEYLETVKARMAAAQGGPEVVYEAWTGAL